MSIKPISLIAVCAAVSGLLGGCKTVAPYDYSNYRAHPPRSILVLPPLNESLNLDGTYSYLSTVTQPVADHGYYVFPVAVVDRFLKENGMPTAGEMQQIPLDKAASILGADAVLFLTLKQYGSKYQLLNSDTTVEVQARLVDTHTATLLWSGHALKQVNPNNSGGGLLASLVAAAVSQIINAKTDSAHQVSRMANVDLFEQKTVGLPYGPYSPRFNQFP